MHAKSKNFRERATVVFLGDAAPPRRLVLLKRAEWKKFAPNMYTGIGGKVEENEEPQKSAERELWEETQIKVPLTEFGRLVVNSRKVLYYFFGRYGSNALPACIEGALEWADCAEILNKDIIPTTHHFIREWAKRHWRIDPFMIIMERTDADDPHSEIISLMVKEGL